MKPHLTWYISLPHALEIIKKMNVKKHRDSGYSFDLEEQPDQDRVWSRPDKLFYAKYPWTTTIFKLEIFYKKPDEATLPVKKVLTSRGTRK